MQLPKVVLTIAVRGTLLSIPVTIRSASSDDASTYSDRDRTQASKDEKEQLERALKTGEEKDFYRRELEKRGWQLRL
jgi:hypothetical protein